MFDWLNMDSYSIIVSSTDINTAEYDYFSVLIPNGIKVNFNGTIIGPFTEAIIVPLTAPVSGVVGLNGLIYFIGNKNFVEGVTPPVPPPIVGDFIVSSNDEFIVSSADENIVWE